MRVRLIYRKDLHTSEVGTIELDSPGPLVAVHTDGGMGTPLADGSCVVYGLSYHCHEQRCLCGSYADKLSLVNPGADVKASLVVPDHLKPVVDMPDRVRTIGESVARTCACYNCNEAARLGHALDKEIMGAEVVGTVYDERANVEEPEPVEPIKSKSVKKRLAAQSRGRASRKQRGKDA